MDMEMDLVSTCKTKLAYFRIKELKEVLGQLGLSKQGKKQDLMDRILGLISDEEVLIARGSVKRNIGKEGVANVIDDAYRKMRMSEGAELSTKGQGGSDICSAKPKTDVEAPSTAVVKIFCPCGSSSPTESMIKCVDPSCQVQQHISCVVIPEKPMEGIPPVPPLYFCEICRIKRADPFWVTRENILSPVKLIASKVPTDGTNPIQNVERTFQLSKANRELLQTTEYDVQAWCILLNDKVSFRMQWPQYADLQVNGIQVRTVNRPGSQLLGANGRDDGALITLYLGEGVNKISLSGCDSRIFCFGVRLVKRRTVEQVLNLIPKETDGKPFEDALARVRRCIGGGGGGGGMATVNEDSDSDLEVIADSITVNLRCPMSGSRMKVAGRFKPCVHMGCFDLETFVEMNQRSRKWQCPICLKNYSLEDIIIDPYFNRITTMMRHCGEDITEIEVKPDGSWTAKTKGELSDLAQWHFPDGSICMAANEVTSNLGTLRQIKKEDDSQGHTNSGRNQNLGGIVEVSKHQHINLSSRNSMEGNFENYDQKIITMSSSTSLSDRDDEEPSINQDFYGHIDISTDNGNETNSTTHNFDPTFGIENRSSAATVDPEVIVLSDSEEENVNMVPHEPIYQACPVNGGGSSLSAPPGIHDSYLEDPALDGGVNSCLGLFNGNGNDIGMSNWQYASGSRAGSGFQLFGADSDVSDAFIDLEHSPVTYSGPINGYTPASNSTINSGGQVLDSSVFHSNMEIDDGLVDNPLAFVSGDHLQNFLPTQPAGVSAQSDLGHLPPISNGRNNEDWVSLRLGSNGESAGRNVGPHSQSVAGRNVGPQSVESNGLDLRNGGGSNKAALLTEMNDEARSNRTKSRKMSNGPFSFPRQPRSVRQRVFLSIDSD